MTINQTTLNEFTDLVTSMMNSTETFDMSVVETLTEDFMQQNGLEFKDYTQFLIEADGDDNAKYWMNFKTTADYFFDQVNSMAITKRMVGQLIESTVNFL